MRASRVFLYHPPQSFATSWCRDEEYLRERGKEERGRGGERGGRRGEGGEGGASIRWRGREVREVERCERWRGERRKGGQEMQERGEGRAERREMRIHLLVHVTHLEDLRRRVEDERTFEDLIFGARALDCVVYPLSPVVLNKNNKKKKKKKKKKEKRRR